MLFIRSNGTRRVVVLLLTFAFLAIGQQRIEADHIQTAACIADGGNWDSSQEICNRPNNILLPVVLALAASAVYAG